jgi:hypothetical protein
MPRVEVFILDHRLTEGIALLALARWREDGRIEAGCITIDFWCEGIRTSEYVELSAEDEWSHYVFEVFNEESHGDRMNPNCARKLIEAAMAYGESNGFRPPGSFRKVKRILNSAVPEACSETWEFGRDGRPHYVPMDEDSVEQVDRILARLEAIHGPDGFTWEDPLAGPHEDTLPESAPPPPLPVVPPPPDAAAIDAALEKALRKLANGPE